MKHIVMVVALVGFGIIFGSLNLYNLNGAASAQFAPPTQSGDSLWHLPIFGADGWFLHASNGMVRACNMDQVSVIGDKTGPKCSNWE